MYSLVISPDGSRIVSSSYDRIIRIWNIDTEDTCKSEVVLTGHHASVHHVAFSPDGSRLVSASRDKTLRIWSTYTGQLETMREGLFPVSSAWFSFDGSLIVTADQVWNPITHEYFGFDKVILSDGTIVKYESSLDRQVMLPLSESNSLYSVSQDRRWIVPRASDSQRRC